MPHTFQSCLTPSNPQLELGNDWTSTTNIQWTQITTRDSYYTVRWQGAFINETPLNVNTGSVIVDSGTTFLVMNQDYLLAIEAAMQSMCSQVFLVGICGQPAGQTLFDGYFVD